MLLTEGGGLTRQDFMTSLRNNFYFVLLVVPAQTALSLFLAVVLNQQLLKAGPSSGRRSTSLP
jgi:multiple sugar transport system permease protein